MDYTMAFNLLFIGMITVFAVLLLVYITGNLLIRFVNAYLPGSMPGDEGIDKKKVAAINAAVEIVTQGKGEVTEIKKQ